MNQDKVIRKREETIKRLSGYLGKTSPLYQLHMAMQEINQDYHKITSKIRDSLENKTTNPSPE